MGEKDYDKLHSAKTLGHHDKPVKVIRVIDPNAIVEESEHENE